MDKGSSNYNQQHNMMGYPSGHQSAINYAPRPIEVTDEHLGPLLVSPEFLSTMAYILSCLDLFREPTEYNRQTQYVAIELSKKIVKLNPDAFKAICNAIVSKEG